MTAVLERPSGAPPARPERQRSADTPQRPLPKEGAARQAGVVALAVASLLPLNRVFATTDWVPAVLLAALLAIALAWAARRLGAGLVATFAALAISWFWYCALVFLSGTLWSGLVPTGATLSAFIDMVMLSIVRIEMIPAPAFPEPSLVLVTVTGVWWIAAIIDVLVTRLYSPGKAIVCAGALWLVPLAISPIPSSAWPLALPFLAASAFLMLSFAGSDVRRWGVWIPSRADQRREQTSGRLATSGALITILALAAGVVLAGTLPGFGDPPWHELRGRAASTLTANPIVQIRANLVARDTGPILRVRSQAPVYLRTTTLDVYSETEEWTNSGIKAGPLADGGSVPGSRLSGTAQEVRIEVVDLSGGVLVPAPTGAIIIGGFDEDVPLFDPRTDTFTLDDGATVDTGNRYTVIAREPLVDAKMLANVADPAPSEFLALPDNVPDEVGELAREIVAEAGSEHPFLQALVIQNELRTWEYSLEPPQGHGAVAMRSFLANRVGYCEQFAGAMAVMLRTLGIPARVAVGFTPGTINPDDPSLWTVSWANAHAWVEVPFAGEWIAFEPTPRSDGNVLVPSVEEVIPRETALPPWRDAQLLPLQSADEIFDYLNLDEALANRAASGGNPQVGGLGDGAGEMSRRLANPRLLTLLASLSVVVLMLLAWLGRMGEQRGVHPRTRVLRARASIGRLATGLGIRPRAAETDREYLMRLIAAGPEADALAAATARARYGPSVSARVAHEAEHAARALEGRLVGDLPAWRRGLVRLRGDVATGYARLRRLTRRGT